MDSCPSCMALRRHLARGADAAMRAEAGMPGLRPNLVSRAATASCCAATCCCSVMTVTAAPYEELPEE